MDSVENAVNLNGPGCVCYEKPTDTYVLDGGSLLYRIGWKKKETFSNIAKRYASFVIKNYGNATVVFDGYSGPSIKDMTNLRRQGNKTSNAIKFNNNTNFLGKQEEFVRNALISSERKNEGCNPIDCDGDADLIIAFADVISGELIAQMISQDIDNVQDGVGLEMIVIN